MGVVSPPGRSCDHGSRLTCGVVGCVFCKKKSKQERQRFERQLSDMIFLKPVAQTLTEVLKAVFTIERVNLEAGHLLGQDGFGQVEHSGVIDGEVTVVAVQHPDGCPLDAADTGSTITDTDGEDHQLSDPP